MKIETRFALSDSAHVYQAASTIAETIHDPKRHIGVRISRSMLRVITYKPLDAGIASGIVDLLEQAEKFQSTNFDFDVLLGD